MARTEILAYPWLSATVYAAELDCEGVVVRANQALADAVVWPVEGSAFNELLAREQRDSFARRLAALGDDWEHATFGFFDGRGVAAEDRTLWLRRLPAGHIEVVAEPAWHERDRLVEQVLQLNDDLIATQRTLSRRHRDLEQAKDEAASSARRVRQLEGIVLAGLVESDFEATLRSLLRTAQQLLPGDRADILLLDEGGETLVLRASSGPAADRPEERRALALGEGILGAIAASGRTALIHERAYEQAGVLGDPGSLLAAPLRVGGQVIGVLSLSARGAGCFSDSHLRLLEIVGERVALAVGQAQLREREHRLAETLQRTLLPRSLPEVAGLEVAARYLPRAANVGGDFYDAIALADGRLGLAIGDVTGKGLRAAAAMGRFRNALHAYAIDVPRPSEVLDRLGCVAVADGDMATALYLVIDPADGRVELASAGHLPPLLLSPKGPGYLDVTPALSPPLGLPEERRTQMELVLAPGESLVLYTDGLVERTRDLDEGLDRLRQAARDVIDASPSEVCEHLLNAMTPSGRYRDDVALLSLRRAG